MWEHPGAVPSHCPGQECRGVWPRLHRSGSGGAPAKHSASAQLTPPLGAAPAAPRIVRTCLTLDPASKPKRLAGLGVKGWGLMTNGAGVRAQTLHRASRPRLVHRVDPGPTTSVNEAVQLPACSPPPWLTASKPQVRTATNDSRGRRGRLAANSSCARTSLPLPCSAPGQSHQAQLTSRRAGPRRRPRAAPRRPL